MFDHNLYLFCERKEELIRDFLGNFNSSTGRLLQNEIFVQRNIGLSNVVNEEQGEWIKIANTDDWIRIGLSDYRIAFTVYYSIPAKPITFLIVSFTVDGGVILGIAVDGDEKYFGYAKELLDKLKNEYGAQNAAIFIEEPPFLSKELFLKAMKECAIYVSPTFIGDFIGAQRESLKFHDANVENVTPHSV